MSEKRDCLVSYNDLDATLTGRIIHPLTPTPSFEYDTPVSNYFSRATEFSFARCDEWFNAKEACFEHRGPTQAASLVVCSKCKEMYGRILKSLVSQTYIEEWLS